MDNETLTKLNFKLVSGRFAMNKNEIVISNHIITNAGIDIKIGDKLNLNIGRRQTLDRI